MILNKDYFRLIVTIKVRLFIMIYKQLVDWKPSISEQSDFNSEG